MSKKSKKHKNGGINSMGGEVYYSLGKKFEPSCHNGPVEIVPGFFCGSEHEILSYLTVDESIDVLVPLNRLDGEVWDMGFRGEILYYPIEDFSILPTDVANDVVGKIINRLQNGKSVGLFCLGGHGRTGYVASIVLGKLGYYDPIEFLREKYCREAVESNSQIKHIAKILNKPWLEGKHNCKLGYFSIYSGCESGIERNYLGSGRSRAFIDDDDEFYFDLMGVE